MPPVHRHLLSSAFFWVPGIQSWKITCTEFVLLWSQLSGGGEKHLRWLNDKARIMQETSDRDEMPIYTILPRSIA